MGAWGPAIFSDDLACDVRDTYKELIEDGVDDDVALERAIEQFREAIDDVDEGPVFWIALAVTQSKIGRLADDVKRRAMAAIDSGSDLTRWTEEKSRRQRQVELDKARAALEGPQPARKRLRPPSRDVTSLVPGDVLGVRLDARLHLLRAARIDDHRLSVAPILVSLDFDGAQLPSPRRLRRLKDRMPTGHRPDPITGRLPEWHSTTFRVIVIKKIDFTDAGFEVVASLPGRSGDQTRQAESHCTWETLLEVLGRTDE